MQQGFNIAQQLVEYERLDSYIIETERTLSILRQQAVEKRNYIENNAPNQAYCVFFKKQKTYLHHQNGLLAVFSSQDILKQVLRGKKRKFGTVIISVPISYFEGQVLNRGTLEKMKWMNRTDQLVFPQEEEKILLL